LDPMKSLLPKIEMNDRVRVMVVNTTFNNIILWQSVLLMEENH
jgi:hypothetical protein